MNNNNNEILKAVQEQKIKNDEFEQSVLSRGTLLAAGITIIVTALLVGIEFKITRRWDFGKPSVVALTCSISYLFNGIKLKRVKELVMGIVSVILFIFCFTMFITELF